jgi:deoxyadenosine/deoxycytidine kinase
MGKLITIIGASGVGKTTLTRVLFEQYQFNTAFEQHAERPFQALFKQDPRYALANQVDYLLHRAEQEKDLRAQPGNAIMDGGLDLDFHGFTRLFLTHGWLSDAEYDLCRRVYLLVRAHQPAPDHIIHLHANEKTISQRLATRNRINIASSEDAGLLGQYIAEWLESIPAGRILQMDVSNEDEKYSATIAQILDRLQNL